LNAWVTDGLTEGGWAIAALVAVLAIALVALLMRRRSRQRGATPMVALVRHRRELLSQLQTLAGDDSEQLVRHEARRLKAGTNSVEVLEAALLRAERLTAQGELQPGRPTKR